MAGELKPTSSNWMWVPLKCLWDLVSDNWISSFVSKDLQATIDGKALRTLSSSD